MKVTLDVDHDTMVKALQVWADSTFVEGSKRKVTAVSAVQTHTRSSQPPTFKIELVLDEAPVFPRIDSTEAPA